MGARKTKPHKPADVGESGNVLKDGPDRPIGKEFPESVVSDHFPQPEEEATLFTTDHLHEGVVGRRLHDETLQPALVVDSGTDRGVCLPLPNTASRLILGRGEDADLRVDDRSVSRQHVALVVDPGLPRPAVYLEDLGSTNGVSVDGVRVRGRQRLRDLDRIQLGDIELIFRLLMPVDIEHRQCLAEEAQEAVRDPLTGCRTRRFLQRSLPALMDSHVRAKVPLSLVVFDIDHFKAINDTHGHAQGDAALRAVATAIEDALRSQDYLVRYGGEEFVAVLPGTDEHRAVTAAERARVGVSRLDLGQVAPGLTVRVSAGVGVMFVGDDVDRWFKRVDAALYQAKRQGRDQVVPVGALPPTA
jgi:two-component system, cell cycle response regulator